MWIWPYLSKQAKVVSPNIFVKHNIPQGLMADLERSILTSLSSPATDNAHVCELKMRLTVLNVLIAKTCIRFSEPSANRLCEQLNKLEIVPELV
jgi:hypothetical protein